MRHVQSKHKEGEHCPEYGTCYVCELFTCTVCGASEGELPTDCPGYELSAGVKENIFKGPLDFVKGHWVTKD